MKEVKGAVIAVATKEEVELAKSLFPDVENIIVTGVGPISVGVSLRGLDPDTVIINVGYCGAVSIEPGTVVEVGFSDLFHTTDYDTPMFELKSGSSIRCHSSINFVEKDDIEGMGFGKDDIFDMELAFICSMFHNVIALKCVSDNLSYDEYEETLAE